MCRYRQRKTGISLVLFLLVFARICIAQGGAVTIIGGGDVMLGGPWESQVAQDSYRYPFKQVAPLLQNADLSFVNLEAPLTTRGSEFVGKTFRFRVNPKAAAALKQSGITTVTLANNHIMDFGTVGLADTLQSARQVGIDVVGAGMNRREARRIQFYTIKGTTVALLGYSLTLPQEFWATDSRAGTALLREAEVREDIALARKRASIVIVAVHWGAEGSTILREYQPRLARMMIDCGADVILGHHPHILQGMERYKQGIIFYSLGNFAFASKSRIATTTMLVRLRFEGKSRYAQLIPLNIDHRRVGFQPTPLSGAAADSVVRAVEQLPPATVRASRDGGYTIPF